MSTSRSLRTLMLVAAAAGIWYASGTMPPALASGLASAVSTSTATVTGAFATVSGALPGGSAAATVVDAGRPVGWATCAKVPVLVNPGTTDPELAASRVRDLTAALAVLAKASGVRFYLAGTTERVPMQDWGHAKVRVGSYRFTPVLVGWTGDGQSDLMTDGQWGAAVANPVIRQGRRILVTGAIALSDSADAQLRPGLGDGLTRGTVLVHELGHLAGLAHDSSGVMTETVDAGTPGAYSPDELTLLQSLAPSCQ